MGKEHFHEVDTSSKVVGVQFTAGSTELIRQSAHIQIFTNRLYEEVQGKWLPAHYGPLDARLGTFQKSVNCATCNQNLQDCVGHFGFIDLEYPVFHIGFFRLIIQTLQCICKACSQVLLQGTHRESLIRQALNPNLDYLRKKALHKKVVTLSKKITICQKCAFINGTVKKAVGAILKIAHAEPITEPMLGINDEQGEQQQLITSSKFNLLDPLKVLEIFKRISLQDLPLLMIGVDELKHPINFLTQRIPVPPVCIRPSVISELKAGSNEDDITMKLHDIMMINNVLKKHKLDGAPMKTICETWDHLQVQCALLINSELSGLPPDLQPKKFVRSFAQRLKGKQGRFRGNLSGKRVDFTARTVISPDPNLKIDQVGVPRQVAMILTFPELVCRSNIERMRQLVHNGDLIYPGANNIIDGKTGQKRFLRYGNREIIAKNLQIGDTIERHLIDGDIVLFNRQPSLHKISIMAHRVKVMPYRTFRFNECACTPYNADFDGDEMNLHLPQTYEAKAEAAILMGLKSNLVSPRAGQPLIAAIQDFITAGHLLTQKDTFLTRSEVQRIAASIIDINEKQRRIRLPQPALIRPKELWTGKQLIELLIAPFIDTDVHLNLMTKNKVHNPEDGEFTHKDTFVLIRNNQLLSGALDKTLLGAESKNSIFFTLLRDWGEQHSIDAMWRLARFSTVYLSNRGFSIGIGDVKPNAKLMKAKAKLLEKGYKICAQLNKAMKLENKKAKPDFGLVEELEAKILKELSNIRDQAGKACREFLSRNNTPLVMAQCGSKGSFINIAQMIALVGQQSISGKRPSDGFESRSLPHFERNDRAPDAKGFVENSFYSGLTPTEFFFHTMGGREGLVDTAVKTAETGYMQRRLVKCLEDLAIAYDETVRTSTNEVVQFVFGDDGLDPAYMEGRDGKLVDFSHILNQVRNTQKKCDKTVSGWDIYELDQIDVHREIERRFLNSSDMHSRQKTLITKKFASQLFQFLWQQFSENKTFLEKQIICQKHTGIASPSTRFSSRSRCKECEHLRIQRQAQIIANGFSLAQLRNFLDFCEPKIRRAIVEPGTAVGAIAATSIGEPSTQMTLKTFHFAGVASMNITQGVPRIKEIINAVRNISTPVITVAIADERNEKLARRVKSRIEKTTLGEISEYIEQVFQSDDLFVLIKLNTRRIRAMQLEVTMDSIIHSICSTRLPIPKIKSAQVRTVGKSMLIVRPIDSAKYSQTMYMHFLKYLLPTVIIKGLPGVNRCVINADRGDSFQLFVEGTNYREVLALTEINGLKTKFNNPLVIAEVLGIEAARAVIISEILTTMSEHGIELDQRHVMLLADLMTYRGEVLGITRNGLVKMKESVLLLASFERTIDHLYEAAFFGQQDRIVGVSECIIMGTPMGIGTGVFKLLQNTTKKEMAEKIVRKSLIKLEPPLSPQPTITTAQQLLAPPEMGTLTKRRGRQSSTSTAITPALNIVKMELDEDAIDEQQRVQFIPPPPPILLHRQPIFEELDLIV